MTRAEAIKQIESLFEHCEAMMTSDEPVWSQDCEALKVALFALRGPTREQVEKMRGEWIIEDAGDGDRRKKCSLCNQPISGWWGRDRFCANCGSPMTDEAVDMVMERLEEMHADRDT